VVKDQVFHMAPVAQNSAADLQAGHHRLLVRNHEPEDLRPFQLVEFFTPGRAEIFNRFAEHPHLTLASVIHRDVEADQKLGFDQGADGVRVHVELAQVAEHGLDIAQRPETWVAQTQLRLDGGRQEINRLGWGGNHRAAGLGFMDISMVSRICFVSCGWL